MKEIISKVTGLRSQLQNIANREVLNQLIDIQIRLENGECSGNMLSSPRGTS